MLHSYIFGRTICGIGHTIKVHQNFILIQRYTSVISIKINELEFVYRNDIIIGAIEI